MHIAHETDLYVPPDVQAAYEAFGANCGPAALAAMLGRPVMDLRRAIEPFRGFMSFADMIRSLKSLGVEHVTMRKDFKLIGALVADAHKWDGRLTIIQWGGKWLQPGVHPGAALSRTHWIAVRHSPELAYDVNAGEYGGWLTFGQWGELAKAIMAEVPKCDGQWSARSTILVRGIR
jgi:hypothetical protein